MTTALLPGEGIAKAEQRIATLEAERQARIDSGEGDYAAAVAAIDAQIASQRSTILVYRQRAAAIERKAQARAAAKLAAEKAAGVANIKYRAEKRLAAAQKLDGILAQVGEAFNEFQAADQALFTDWPAAVTTLGHLGHFHVAELEPLSRARRARPPSPGIIRSVVEHLPFNFAATVEQRNRELVELVHDAPAVNSERAA